MPQQPQQIEQLELAKIALGNLSKDIKKYIRLSDSESSSSSDAGDGSSIDSDHPVDLDAYIAQVNTHKQVFVGCISYLMILHMDHGYDVSSSDALRCMDELIEAVNKTSVIDLDSATDSETMLGDINDDFGILSHNVTSFLHELSVGGAQASAEKEDFPAISAS